MEARIARPKDRESWLRIRRTIWPHASAKAHEKEIDAGFAQEDGRRFVMVKEEDGGRVAYLECRLVPAEGDWEDAVGRIEAWYIVPNFRAGGVGRALLRFLNMWFQARRFCASLTAHEDLSADVPFRANMDQPTLDSPMFFDFEKR